MAQSYFDRLLFVVGCAGVVAKLNEGATADTAGATAAGVPKLKEGAAFATGMPGLCEKISTEWIVRLLEIINNTIFKHT